MDRPLDQPRRKRSKPARPRQRRTSRRHRHPDVGSGDRGRTEEPVRGLPRRHWRVWARHRGWQAAGFTPDQLQGFDAAPGGPASMQTPLDELMATARGDYLYGGEGFNAAVDAAYRAGCPSAVQFRRDGRDDGGLAKTALAKAFADPFAMQYGDERARQQAAQFGLPQLSLLPGQTSTRTSADSSSSSSNTASTTRSSPSRNMHPCSPAPRAWPRRSSARSAPATPAA